MSLKREIRVDFYKETGKWYAGGNVLVMHHLFENGFRQDIVNNQNIMQDGWQGNYIVVTDDINGDLFSKQVFLPSKFNGIYKMKQLINKEMFIKQKDYKIDSDPLLNSCDVANCDMSSLYPSILKK